MSYGCAVLTDTPPTPSQEGSYVLFRSPPLERGAIAALLDVSVIGCAVGRWCFRLHLGIVKIVRKEGKEIKKAALHSGASVHLKIYMKRVIHISLAGV